LSTVWIKYQSEHAISCIPRAVQAQTSTPKILRLPPRKPRDSVSFSDLEVRLHASFMSSSDLSCQTGALTLRQRGRTTNMIRGGRSLKHLPTRVSGRRIFRVVPCSRDDTWGEMFFCAGRKGYPTLCRGQIVKETSILSRKLIIHGEQRFQRSPCCVENIYNRGSDCPPHQNRIGIENNVETIPIVLGESLGYGNVKVINDRVVITTNILSRQLPCTASL
jgi:hypothetical protein